MMEMRVALTVEDFDAAVAFYRDGLGLEASELWTDGGKGQLFLAGNASLEIFDEEYAAGIDSLEVGSRVSGQIRFAFRVTGLDKAIERACAYGAVLVAKARRTPWGDRNARLMTPEGLQVTLFEAGDEALP